MRKIILYGFVLLSISTRVSAGGISIVGGGDDLGLEFQQAYSAAVKEIRRDLPELYEILNTNGLAEFPSSVSVIVVDTDLTVSTDGRLQYSTAVNDAIKNTILINRVRWSTIRDPQVKGALALHEVASLKGLEVTGRYPISGKYLSHYGIITSSLESFAITCVAPRSVHSSCPNQMEDMTYGDIETSQASVIRSDYPIWDGSVQNVKVNSKYVMFYDENKSYQIAANYIDRKIPQDELFTMEIMTYHTTDNPLKEMKRRIVKRYIRGKKDKIDVEKSEANFLISHLGEGRARVEAYPESNGSDINTMESLISSKTYDGGVVVSTHSSLDLDIPVDEHTSIQAIYNKSIIWPITSSDFREGLGSNILTATDIFSAKHTLVLDIKSRLNQCLQAGSSNCLELRQEYEKADKERDALFLSMIKPEDIKFKWKPKKHPRPKNGEQDLSGFSSAGAALE